MKTTMKFLLITIIFLIFTVPGYTNNTTEPEIRTAVYPESKAYSRTSLRISGLQK